MSSSEAVKQVLEAQGGMIYPGQDITPKVKTHIALAESAKNRAKYVPERDRERMKIYMKDKRAKDRAGHKGMTVTAYRAMLANQATETA